MSVPIDITMGVAHGRGRTTSTYFPPIFQLCEHAPQVANLVVAVLFPCDTGYLDFLHEIFRYEKVDRYIRLLNTVCAK